MRDARSTDPAPPPLPTFDPGNISSIARITPRRLCASTSNSRTPLVYLRAKPEVKATVAVIPAYLPPDIAARTRGGDIGRCVILVCVAVSIALAMAAIGGQMFASPTPLAPYGCTGFGTSTRMVSIIGMSDATGQR